MGSLSSRKQSLKTRSRSVSSAPSFDIKSSDCKNGKNSPRKLSNYKCDAAIKFIVNDLFKDDFKSCRDDKSRVNIHKSKGKLIGHSPQRNPPNHDSEKERRLSKNVSLRRNSFQNDSNNEVTLEYPDRLERVTVCYDDKGNEIDNETPLIESERINSETINTFQKSRPPVSDSESDITTTMSTERYENINKILRPSSLKQRRCYRINIPQTKMKANPAKNVRNRKRMPIQRPHSLYYRQTYRDCTSSGADPTTESTSQLDISDNYASKPNYTDDVRYRKNDSNAGPKVTYKMHQRALYPERNKTAVSKINSDRDITSSESSRKPKQKNTKLLQSTESYRLLIPRSSKDDWYKDKRPDTEPSVTTITTEETHGNKKNTDPSSCYFKEKNHPDNYLKEKTKVDFYPIPKDRVYKARNGILKRTGIDKPTIIIEEVESSDQMSKSTSPSRDIKKDWLTVKTDDYATGYTDKYSDDSKQYGDDYYDENYDEKEDDYDSATKTGDNDQYEDYSNENENYDEEYENDYYDENADDAYYNSQNDGDQYYNEDDYYEETYEEAEERRWMNEKQFDTDIYGYYSPTEQAFLILESERNCHNNNAIEDIEAMITQHYSNSQTFKESKIEDHVDKQRTKLNIKDLRKTIKYNRLLMDPIFRCFKTKEKMQFGRDFIKCFRNAENCQLYLDESLSHKMLSSSRKHEAIIRRSVSELEELAALENLLHSIQHKRPHWVDLAAITQSDEIFKSFLVKHASITRYKSKSPPSWIKNNAKSIKEWREYRVDSNRQTPKLLKDIIKKIYA